MAEKAMSSCVFNAKDSGKSILSGNLVKALKTLSLTKESGKALENKLESILSRLENLEKYNKRKEEAYYSLLKDRKNEKTSLISRKSSLETCIFSKSASVRETERLLNDARDEINSAKRERNRAQEKYDKVKKYWWVPIYGQVLAIKELIEGNEYKANEAQSRMNRYEREVREYNSELKKSKEELENLNDIIRNVESDLRDCNRKISSIKSNIETICSAIGEVLDAKEYWRSSVSETKSANKSTNHMEKLVNTSNAKKKLVDFSKSYATKLMVNKYDSQWEKVESVLGDAFLNKVSLTFTCSHCNITKTSLPYIEHLDTFVCEDCFENKYTYKVS